MSENPPANPAGRPRAPEDPPIRSDLNGDPDMAALIDYFLSELDGRIEELSKAAATGNGPLVLRLAHQLKGAGGGYGYPAITEKAAELERALRSEELDVGRTRDRVEDLLSLCRRAIAARS